MGWTGVVVVVVVVVKVWVGTISGTLHFDSVVWEACGVGAEWYTEVKRNWTMAESAMIEATVQLLEQAWIVRRSQLE
jgi:hypothetical protein